ncbi:hypothetical protein AAG570_007260 [Ranatra chinensis]|uniref:Uncharacterized protein n=1 Tax=Ranatra chinensis TaxID=642074 RepID=A0ABD0YH61_9HEMI
MLLKPAGPFRIADFLSALKFLFLAFCGRLRGLSALEDGDAEAGQDGAEDAPDGIPIRGKGPLYNDVNGLSHSLDGAMFYRPLAVVMTTVETSRMTPPPTASESKGADVTPKRQKLEAKVQKTETRIDKKKFTSLSEAERVFTTVCVNTGDNKVPSHFYGRPRYVYLHVERYDKRRILRDVCSDFVLECREHEKKKKKLVKDRTRVFKPVLYNGGRFREEQKKKKQTGRNVTGNSGREQKEEGGKEVSPLPSRTATANWERLETSIFIAAGERSEEARYSFGETAVVGG